MTVNISSTIVVLLAVAFWAMRRFALKGKSDLPTVGLRNEFFGRLRLTRRNLREAKGLKNLIFEGYHKASWIDKENDSSQTKYKQFTKAGKLFILPCWLNGDAVLLPLSYANLVGNAPDAELDPYPVADENMQKDYTFRIRPNEEFLVEIIRKHLTGASLAAMMPTLQEEIEFSISDIWGLDTVNWTTVNPWPTTVQIASRALNRVVVGTSLCRNPLYISSIVSYMRTVLINALTIKAFPRILRPIVGRFISRKANDNLKTLTDLVLPIVEERCKQLDLKQKNPSMDWETPNDFITWQIEASYRHNDPKEREPFVICERLNVLNLLAGHTSPNALSNFLLELFSTNPEDGYVEALREEVERVHHEFEGKWTPVALAKLIRVDSALKESFRLHPLGMKSVERMVMKEEGFKVGDVTISKGSVVCFPNFEIQCDDVNWKNATTFDPLRYSRPLEENSLVDSVHARKVASAATPDPKFLHFGYGRHACPGRFIAVQLLKIDIAYILMNYDIQPLEKRPATVFRNLALLPPMGFAINVRRRFRP